MTTLTVWRFADPDGAARAAKILTRLSQDNLITVHDAATVSWHPGRTKPKTRQLHDLTGSGALGGAFWGMLFGLIFFIPLLGAAVGATVGALTGTLTDVGISDDLIRRLRTDVVPGTSALFILSSDAVLDKVRTSFEPEHPELVFTNLSAVEEARLREIFGDDHVPA